MLFVLAGIHGYLFSQVPQGIPYQALIRDSEGLPVVNSVVSVRFTLHSDSQNGIIEYQETQTLTTNGFGLINTLFGSGEVIIGNFTGINWSNYLKFIQIEADQGNGYVDMGTQQLMTVPYAFFSAQSSTPGPVGPQGPAGLGIVGITISNNVMIFEMSNDSLIELPLTYPQGISSEDLKRLKTQIYLNGF
jgi:hypothetical protein